MRNGGRKAEVLVGLRDTTARKSTSPSRARGVSSLRPAHLVPADRAALGAAFRVADHHAAYAAHLERLTAPPDAREGVRAAECRRAMRRQHTRGGPVPLVLPPALLVVRPIDPRRPLQKPMRVPRAQVALM